MFGNAFTKSAATVMAFAVALSPLSYAEIDGREDRVDDLFNSYLQDGIAATSATVEIRERLDNGAYVTRYRKSYGRLTDDVNSRATPTNVLMRTASVAKTIVAAAANGLVNSDRLAMDSAVFCDSRETPRAGTTANSNCVLPFDGEFSDQKYYDITIRHLIEHFSGLDEDNLTPNAVFDSEFTPTMEDLINRMRSTALVDAPGNEDRYSNIGYDLLAFIVGRASLEGDFITHVRNMAKRIGVCESDLRLANPLFLGSVMGREPEYYSHDSFESPNFFRRPSNTVPLGAMVSAEDGGGAYGFQAGAGGLLMTTRAMLLFAQEFDLFSGEPRRTGFTLIRAGGGPGTLAILAQGMAGRYDFAYIVNANEPDVSQEDLYRGLEAIINDIPATPSSQYDAAVAISSSYDTACGSFSSVEEPNHEVAFRQWKYFAISNASRITLFNLSSDADLYVKKGNANPTVTSYDCRPYLVGQRHESCDLDSNSVYRVGVRGWRAGKFMLDVEYSYQFEEGSFSEGTSIRSDGAGTNFADTENKAEEWIGVVVNVPATGQYDLALRYSNGSSTSRTMNVIVNDVNVGQLSGVSTGSWKAWQTETLTNIALNEGSNSIRFVAQTTHGTPFMDKLDIKH